MEKPKQEESQTGLSAKSIASGEQTSRLMPDQLVAGRYRILSLIAQGGMGAVYRAEQVFLRKQYALKTLTSGDVSDVNWRRFQKEARAAALLDHPNLIKVHDCGLINDDQPFFIMDLVDGVTLAQMIKTTNHLPLNTGLEIFVQACRGIGHAHSLGLVHRDIKPSNIMVANADNVAELQVKIVDFSIAKLVATDDSESLALTKTGEVFGTPYYPEQALGLAVEQSSDIY